jgi:ATP-binding protein involved in chromosome partitioning
VNLALALAAEGAQLMCARHLRALAADDARHLEQAESRDGKTLEPLEAYGVQAMSIGFLIDVDTHGVARPVVTGARAAPGIPTGDIDYLIVVAAGHRHIQLTLAQKFR